MAMLRGVIPASPILRLEWGYQGQRPQPVSLLGECWTHAFVAYTTPRQQGKARSECSHSKVLNLACERVAGGSLPAIVSQRSSCVQFSRHYGRPSRKGIPYMNMTSDRIGTERNSLLPLSHHPRRRQRRDDGHGLFRVREPQILLIQHGSPLSCSASTAFRWNNRHRHRWQQWRRPAEVACFTQIALQAMATRSPQTAASRLDRKARKRSIGFSMPALSMIPLTTTARLTSNSSSKK